MRVVAFDLDLTLADTRRGVQVALETLALRTGRAIDVTGAVSRLGIPMADELSRYFPADEVEPAVFAARELFLSVGVPACTAFDGATDALAGLVSQGITVHVVTSRHPAVADALLAATGLDNFVSGVDGLVFGPEKVPVLRRLAPSMYVGDHIADMRAGVDAEVVTVGVTTGNHSAADLLAAGATYVVSGLDGLGPLDL